jgi:hypothetical protein
MLEGTLPLDNGVWVQLQQDSLQEITIFTAKFTSLFENPDEPNVYASIENIQLFKVSQKQRKIESGNEMRKDNLNQKRKTEEQAKK